MICLFGWLAGSDFVQNCSFTDRFVVQCSCWSNNFRHVTVDQILLRWFARRDRLIIVPPCHERSSARVDLKAGRHKRMLQQHSQLGSCGSAGLDMHRTRPRRMGGCISRLRDSCSCLLHLLSPVAILLTNCFRSPNIGPLDPALPYVGFSNINS